MPGAQGGGAPNWMVMSNDTVNNMITQMSTNKQIWHEYVNDNILVITTLG